jgi:hypothetical protein
MEFDLEQLDRFLRWKKIMLWIVFALICAGIVVACAIYYGSRSGSGDQGDSESQLNFHAVRPLLVSRRPSPVFAKPATGFDAGLNQP